MLLLAPALDRASDLITLAQSVEPTRAEGWLKVAEDTTTLVLDGLLVGVKEAISGDLPPGTAAERERSAADLHTEITNLVGRGLRRRAS
jgi:hypothetical protein